MSEPLTPTGQSPSERTTGWRVLGRSAYPRSFALRLTLTTMLVSMLSVLAIAVAALWIVYGVIQKKETALLQKDVFVASATLSVELNAFVDAVQALARNPVLVNGLSNGESGRVALTTVLANARVGQDAPVGLVVLDYRLRPLASNRESLTNNPSAAALADFTSPSATTSTSTPSTGSAQMIELSGQWDLRLIEPITFPDSNATQGYVVATMAIEPMLAQWVAPNRDPRRWSLAFNHMGGRAQTQAFNGAGTGVGAGAGDGPLQFENPLVVKEPLSELSLVLRMDETDLGALEALRVLLPIFGSLLLLALMTAGWLSWRLGRRLARPIVALAEHARTISETGRVLPALAVQGDDETAQLTRDMNTMLTELERLRAQLERTAQIRGARLATIFELSPDGFVEIDPAGEIAYLNPAFTQLTGIALDHLAKKTGAALLQQLDALRESTDEPLTTWMRAHETNANAERLVRLHTPSLKTLGLAVRYGSAGEIILYWRDLTREAEMNALKSAFFAKAAHEIRTPLTSILGFTELLEKETAANERQHKMVSIMQRQGQHLLHLINDLLDLARIEVQRSDWQTQTPQSLVALTQLIVRDFQMPGQTREWLFALEEHLPEVRIDANAYRQVLTNLLSNACKYSPAGSPITIGSRTRKRDGVSWQGIAITDQGVGMNAEELTHMGERFYRAHPEGQIKGTGLGLSVVYEIMRTHDGEVEFISGAGEGTTVIVWFRAQAV